MDYSQCPEREIWPFLKGSNISETGETTPIKTDVHARGIDPYLHDFFSRFRLIKFFHFYGPWTNFISETGEAPPIKIGVHACYINAYLHEFFEPIPID